MPIISLITAVVDGLHEFLPETYDSLRAQELPRDWTWEWVVQEDGETGRPGSLLPTDDPRVSYAMAQRGRASTARTLALPRAAGTFVRALDADDMLTPGALARDVEVLTTQPVGWVVSPARDLMPDGEVVDGPRDPDPGILPEQTMYDGERDGLLPVLGTTVTTHTSLVRALGAWQALPTDEDVALLLALEAVSPGWMLGEPSLLYRRWPGQTTADKDVNRPAEHSIRREVVMERADALRAMSWRWTPQGQPA